MRRLAGAGGILRFAATLLPQTRVGPINEPSVRVHVNRLEFRDTPGLPADIEDEIARAVTSQSYGPGYCAQIGEIVRDGLQRHGYFKAAVEDPKCEIVKRVGDRISVNAAVVAVLGKQYQVGPIEFVAPKHVFPDPEMRAQFPIAEGEIFNVEKVRQGMKGLKDLYCAKGYADFTPIPDLTFDEHTQRIALKVDIDEGEQYRVGKLMVDGEESQPGAKERLLKGWKKYEGGNHCDAGQLFLRDLHAQANLPFDQIVKVEQDKTNHLLNFRIMLGKPGSRLSFAP